MNVGDIVRCKWQPRSSHIEVINGEEFCVPMKITIQGELGVIVKQNGWCNVVSFPHLMHEHPLADHTLEVISESR